MLEEADIEVRISNGRSYRGAIRGNFSYRDDGARGPRPAVWVIRSDQQPEARRILREAGLLQAAPARGESFLPPPASLAGGDRSPMSARGGGRFRYGMLLAVGVMAALVMLAWRSAHRGEDAPAGADTTTVMTTTATPPAAAPPDTAFPAAMPEVATLPDQAFVVATPPALAATLVREALAGEGTRRGCLAVDDADPDAGLLQALAADGLEVAAASACPDASVSVAVDSYTTDGSGRGTVRLTVADGDPRVLPVRREGHDWLRDDAR